MFEREKLVAAFNEWLRRYMEEPEAFASQWSFIKRALAGDTSYGEECVRYLEEVMR